MLSNNKFGYFARNRNYISSEWIWRVINGEDLAIIAETFPTLDEAVEKYYGSCPDDCDYGFYKLSSGGKWQPLCNEDLFPSADRVLEKQGKRGTVVYSVTRIMNGQFCSQSVFDNYLAAKEFKEYWEKTYNKHTNKFVIERSKVQSKSGIIF